MKIGIIIQARMGSQRLPGKVLKEIGGKTLLDILISRIKPCGLPIVIATTDKVIDDIIEQKANSLQVDCFRGNEEDVLDRYFRCAERFNYETIIRLTADNIFIDAKLIEEAVSIYKSYNDTNLYLTTSLFPLGIALEIFSFSALSDAYLNANEFKEREHVTPYIINNPCISKKFLYHTKNKEQYRLTIDSEADFELARLLIIDYKADNLNIEELITVLDNNPELANRNIHVHQKNWNE